MAKIIVKNFLEYMRRVIMIWVGFCLLMLGLIGLVFPFLPGIIFLILGLAFVAKGSDTFRELRHIKSLFTYIKDRLNKQKGMIRRLASLF